MSDDDEFLPVLPVQDERTLEVTKWHFERDPEKNDSVRIVEAEGLSSDWNGYFVNPGEYHPRYGTELWEFQFGAYGDTRLLVYSKSLEDALEEAAGWLAEFAPGHLTDLKEEYENALKEAREELGEDADEEELTEKAQEIAETDMTHTESGYLTSWEWHAGEVRDPGLRQAAEYCASALHAASQNQYDLIMRKPVGSEDAEPFEMSEEEMLELFGDAKLGLTSTQVEQIVALKEDQQVSLESFRIRRVG